MSRYRVCRCTTSVCQSMSRGVVGKVSGVLLDLSGTLHVDNTPTVSAVAALNRLREANLPIRFITNTTKESKRVLYTRLRSIGFDVSEGEIFTSLTAARQLVERDKLRPLLLLEDSAREDFEGISDAQMGPHDSVVVGLAPSRLQYDHLNQAFRLLVEGGRLIAIHKARYYKREDGLAIGPGPYVEALEYASGRTAEVVGKPQPAFFNSVLRELHCPASEAVMIGDDVLNDIKGAQDVGMRGILVQTGKYRDGDETTIHPPPALLCDNFASAVECILNSQSVQLS